MNRWPIILSLLLLVLFAGGCSDSSSDAPLPGEAHPGDWIFSHGAEAAADLEGCQLCHGLDFRGSGEAVSCFACHLDGPPFAIHPWADPISGHIVFAAESGFDSCAVSACHGSDLRGGLTGPSCFSTTYTSADGQTRACHPDGPGTVPHPLPFADPADHGPEAKQLGQAFCQICHGTPGTIFFDGGIAATACSALACHPDAGAHPTNWQGSNDTTATNGYFSTHRNIDPATAYRTENCGICHKTDGAGAGPDPLAPSCFSANFTNSDGSATNCHPGGPGTAPHPLDGSYLDGAAHGPEAKADLTSCQSCHANPAAGGPGSNPRFNVGIDSAGGNGCEGCHNDFTAHPSSPGGREDVPWYDVNVTHRDAGNLTNACGLCHGVNLDGVGGVGPACSDCHQADPVANPTGCVSCHNLPPDEKPPADNVRPNREGRHDRNGHSGKIDPTPLNTCATCHTGAGFDTAAHFDFASPADVPQAPAGPLPDPADPGRDITFVSDPGNTTCTGDCHNHSHDDDTWY